MKLIDLYHEWMETGKIKEHPKSMGAGGLCNAVPPKYLKTLELLEPDDDDYTTFWGNENYAYGADVASDIEYQFTPRRQTIVLLICAIHGEI
jgi:hypothetical protein